MKTRLPHPSLVVCLWLTATACSGPPIDTGLPELGTDASPSPEPEPSPTEDVGLPLDVELVEDADPVEDSDPSPDAGVPDVSCEIPPLAPIYGEDTPLEPELQTETGEALITRLADRARDRHAREDIVGGIPFRRYDHYLPFYWEQRVANIEIVDQVARGGQGVIFNFTTLSKLNPAEFRCFYANQPSVAVYHLNLSDGVGSGVTYLGANPSSSYPGEMEHAYTATVERQFPENRPLVIGDRIEIELSQFLQSPRNGRTNYYGTALLYIVGEGIVPWYARAREEAASPEEAARASFEAHPIPEEGWLGGQTTLSYPYSNEPTHRFKQTAGNLSHRSGLDFMLGRRLHHTDFATGAHSEPGNPAFGAQAGKAGPLAVTHGCVSCHVNNGRDLPPEVGSALRSAVVKVAADGRGTPHPTLGDALQPLGEARGIGEVLLHREAEDHSAADGIMTEATTDEGGGVNVGFIDPGDSMTYEGVDVPGDGPGRFVFSFRVASDVGGGRMVLTGPQGRPEYGSLDIPNTGGWQTWITSEMHVAVSSGLQTFEIHAEAGGWNINWFELRAAESSSAVEGPAFLDSYEIIEGQYGDGEPFSLRRPIYAFGGEVPVHFSVRLAPPLVGLGLLEALDDADIAALADPCDEDGDGISGRIRALAFDGDSEVRRLGRFGYKGGQPSATHQIAAALNRDMGVTTALFPLLDGEAPDAAQGREPELSRADLDLMHRYIALLGVPARRGLSDPQVARGQALFSEAGCDSCHTPTLTTGLHHPFAELRGQVIHPYTDLLLHDMGLGLSDRLDQPGAAASEWRTAPLWGLGLTAGVSGGGEAYLHDGRARDLAEAILWHGGEAEASQEAFRQMPREDREALLIFLSSL